MTEIVAMEENKLHYEYHAPGEHHHHPVCQQCSGNIQVPECGFAALKTELEQRYGFVLNIDHLALPGRCAQCTATDEPSN